MGIHTLDFYLQSMAESCSKRYFLQEIRKYDLYKFQHWNPPAFLPQALESSPAFLIHPMSEFPKREASQPDHLQSRLPGFIGTGWTCSASGLSPTWDSICWTEYMRIISQTYSVTPARNPSLSTRWRFMVGRDDFGRTRSWEWSSWAHSTPWYRQSPSSVPLFLLFPWQHEGVSWAPS